ncbi:MAG: hypothetical protein LBH51_06600 [Treponema sp.]|jgi:hypothetical protein|nr:hypothetical protein [Treponema sp.]
MRKLLFASLLGILGAALYGQSAAGEGRIVWGDQNTGAARETSMHRTPHARVTVIPGPEGLPLVDSYASYAPGWYRSSAPEGEGLILGQNGNSRPVVQESQWNGGDPSKRPAYAPSYTYHNGAGHPVIDPLWRESINSIIQAESDSQRAGPPPKEPAVEAEQKKVKETVVMVPGSTIWRIRGTLTAAKGMFVLVDSDGIFWYLPGLDRYIGYIDGLDAGEGAVVEGYVLSQGSSRERYFRPLKIYIDQGAYDLAGLSESVYPSEGVTIIREVERRDSETPRNHPKVPDCPREKRRSGDRMSWDDDDWYDADDWERILVIRNRRSKTPAPAPSERVHNHSSPWAPPTTVLDFKVDTSEYFWRDDPVKLKLRAREKRGIW